MSGAVQVYHEHGVAELHPTMQRAWLVTYAVTAPGLLVDVGVEVRSDGSLGEEDALVRERMDPACGTVIR